MKRIIAWVGVLALIPMLMGPTGGFPSFARLRALSAGTCQLTHSIVGFAELCNTTAPTINWQSTASAADTKIWDCYGDSAGIFHCRAINDLYTVGNDWLTVTRTAGVPLAVSLIGVDVTPTSGTFNSAVQGTGCTTGSVTWAYKRIGGIVSLKLTARTNFPAACSGATMIDSGGAFPAALRPTTSAEVFIGHGTNNAAAASLCAQFLSTGNINYGILDTTGCNTSGWTGVGNRDFAVGDTATYTLN